MTTTIIASLILIIQVIFIVIYILLAKKHKSVVSKSTFLWFIPVFLFLFSLYTLAYIQTAETIGFLGLLAGLSDSIKTFAFEINLTYINTLLNSNIMFSISFYLAFALAALTVVGTAISIFRDYVLNRLRIRKTLKKSTDILIGFNPSTLTYINSNNFNKNILVLAETKLSDDEKGYLYDNKIPFINQQLTNNNFYELGFNKSTLYNFISFEKNDSQYERLIEQLYNLANNGFQINLFLEVLNNEIEVVRNTFLKRNENNVNFKVKIFSRHEMIARKFVEEVTLPLLMPQDFFLANRAIKLEKEVNVIYYGFSKEDEVILPVFMQNNQLVTMENKKLKSKLVNYYIVSKSDGYIEDMRLDYMISKSENLQSDFPIPEPIANLNYLEEKVNSKDIIDTINDIISNEDSFNLIITNTGSDYENLNSAIWLKDNLAKLNTKVKFAAKLKTSHLKYPEIITFGNEEEILTHRYIVDEELDTIARKIDDNYHSLNNTKSTWDLYNQFMLYSNRYNALNIRFKLNLLGLNYTRDDNVLSLSNSQLDQVLSNPTNKYNYDDYFLLTNRNVIAYSEKLRWNAYHLLNGYTPMRKRDIKFSTNNVYRRDEELKTHACLTSYYGLDELTKYLLNHEDNKIPLSLENLDYYKYDYMTLDNKDNNIFKLLNKEGYKFYKI